MLSRLLAPVRSIDLHSLRLAGRFASPEGEGGEGKGGDGGEGDGKPEGGGKPSDPTSRISALVEERNAERQKAATLQAKIDAMQRQVEELKGGEKAVADLQKQLEDTRAATATRFDKLLETELASLPEAAQKAVKAIPGGSEAQFDWLVSNRAILQPAGEGKPEDKKPAGPTNDKKPPKGSDAGASSVAKSYVESRKPNKTGYPGLTG